MYSQPMHIFFLFPLLYLLILIHSTETYRGRRMSTSISIANPVHVAAAHLCHQHHFVWTGPDQERMRSKCICSCIEAVAWDGQNHQLYHTLTCALHPEIKVEKQLLTLSGVTDTVLIYAHDTSFPLPTFSSHHHFINIPNGEHSRFTGKHIHK